MIETIHESSISMTRPFPGKFYVVMLRAEHQKYIVTDEGVSNKNHQVSVEEYDNNNNNNILLIYIAPFL